MLCPKCGRELQADERICPDCGQTLHEPETEEIPEDVDLMEIFGTATEAPEAEKTTELEEAPAEEPESLEEPEEAPEDSTQKAKKSKKTEESKKKRGSPLAIVLAAIIGLLLIIVVCLTITVTTLSRSGHMPGFVSAITDRFKNAGYHADAVAANVTDDSGNEIAALSNAQFSYYYWGEFYYYYQNSGYGLDMTQDFSETMYDDEHTWQDFFVENACVAISQIEALKAAAEADGFTMPEDFQAEFDATMEGMADYALQAGFTDAEGNGDSLAYIQDSYGPNATMESFTQYLYDSYYVTAYTDTIYYDIVGDGENPGVTFTDEEIEAYYDENAEMFQMYGIEKSDTPNVNVRHILIQPETDDEGNISDEAQKAAEDEADRIYQEWQDGEATEDSFAALAETYSTDPGSSLSGGLYEDVYPGQMVESFNDWCFDPDRKPGDTAVVETDYGYHIMYFVGATDNYYWKNAVTSELYYNKYQQTVDAITASCTASPTDKLSILMPDAIKLLQEEAAASSAAADEAPTTIDLTDMDIDLDDLDLGELGLDDLFTDTDE